MALTKDIDNFNIDAAPWDLRTFKGRLKYFFWVTDPRLCLTDERELEKAYEIRALYKKGIVKPGTKVDDLLQAKRLYESAFHPDTGERQNIFGRMCFQVPGGMTVTGIMLSFYRTNTAIIFWQWVNQSFNAFVNYTNRNANSPLTNKQMGVAYTTATVSACLTAIKFKSYLSKHANTLLQRYVPFAAVAAANFVNIPLMRQNEIIHGIDVFDENGNKCGTSRAAAIRGITQVAISRVVMCAPGMLLLPLVMEVLCNKSVWMRRSVWIHAPFQTFGVGSILLMMVPTACALFPQISAIKTSKLKSYERKAYDEIVQNCGGKAPDVVYYNKGL